MPTNEFFSCQISLGLAAGQFVSCSLGRGLNQSIALNPHYNPDDSRGLLAGRELDKYQQTIESVITIVCYGAEQFQVTQHSS